MNYLEIAQKLEQMAQSEGIDKKAGAELKQKAQEFRAKHTAVK